MRDGALPYFQSSDWGTLISICSAFAQDGICGSIIFIGIVASFITSPGVARGKTHILYSAALISTVSFGFPGVSLSAESSPSCP